MPTPAEYGNEKHLNIINLLNFIYFRGHLSSSLYQRLLHKLDFALARYTFFREDWQ